MVLGADSAYLAEPRRESSLWNRMAARNGRTSPMSLREASPPLAIPFAESPLLESALPALAPVERSLVRTFAEQGYLVLDLDLPDFDRLAREVLDTLGSHYPPDDRRVDEAWYFCPAVRAIASAPKVLDTLRLLYGRQPFPFQTLNFDHGTQQAAHSDTIHFHCVPRYFMCGAWVALEDVDADNGPLFIHPGSHRLPDYTMTDLGLDAVKSAYGEYEKRVAEILAAKGFPREELHLRKGQAVIWAANTYHGGSPIRDPQRTRHSQATHYYFDDCLYYFPMGSEPFAGKVTVREAIDIASGRFVKPRYCGREFHAADYPYVWSYERPLPDWVDPPREPETADAAGEDPEVLRMRVRVLEKTVTHLREDARKILEENALVYEDNRKKDAFIQKRDSELAYKIARRLTKTVRAMFGSNAT